MPTTPGMPRWHCGGVGFALAIGAGTGHPHGGQHRHRGALACESNSDHGRASFIADGCVGAAPRQSVHIISALAGTLVGQHFLLRFPRTQRPRPRLRLRPQPPKPPPACSLYPKQLRKISSSVRKRHTGIEPGYLLPLLQGYPESFPTTAAQSTRVRVPLQHNAVSQTST